MSPATPAAVSRSFPAVSAGWVTPGKRASSRREPAAALSQRGTRRDLVGDDAHAAAGRAAMRFDHGVALASDTA